MANSGAKTGFSQKTLIVSDVLRKSRMQAMSKNRSL